MRKYSTSNYELSKHELCLSIMNFSKHAYCLLNISELVTETNTAFLMYSSIFIGKTNENVFIFTEIKWPLNFHFLPL